MKSHGNGLGVPGGANVKSANPNVVTQAHPTAQLLGREIGCVGSGGGVEREGGAWGWGRVRRIGGVIVN